MLRRRRFRRGRTRLRVSVRVNAAWYGGKYVNLTLSEKEIVGMISVAHVDLFACVWRTCRVNMLVIRIALAGEGRKDSLYGFVAQKTYFSPSNLTLH